MAIWQSRPDTDAERLPYRIHRAPANKPIKGIIVSKGIVGTNLHYWKGRSTPCTENNCPACESGQKPRWKGYLQLQSSDHRTVRIVEITDRVFGIFDDATRKHGSLRGLGCTISRINARANAPLNAEIHGVQASDAELPEEADMVAILERMWESRQTGLPGCESEGDPRGAIKMRQQA